eukprot:TRINITY_DN8071_c0_g1_i1.p1 TRINITY_DN8071_c0_g1~~TRINITY_DN8071_c0_g1_i1.p1  ORF type:complete len:394 (-),score=92.43 TRINITY_DN8071_c0_g1_i1:1159-2340(-)
MSSTSIHPVEQNGRSSDHSESSSDPSIEVLKDVSSRHIAYKAWLKMVREEMASGKLDYQYFVSSLKWLKKAYSKFPLQSHPLLQLVQRIQLFDGIIEAWDQFFTDHAKFPTHHKKKGETDSSNYNVNSVNNSFISSILRESSEEINGHGSEGKNRAIVDYITKAIESLTRDKLGKLFKMTTLLQPISDLIEFLVVDTRGRAHLLLLSTLHSGNTTPPHISPTFLITSADTSQTTNNSNSPIEIKPLPPLISNLPPPPIQLKNPLAKTTIILPEIDPNKPSNGHLNSNNNNHNSRSNSISSDGGLENEEPIIVPSPNIPTLSHHTSQFIQPISVTLSPRSRPNSTFTATISFQPGKPEAFLSPRGAQTPRGSFSSHVNPLNHNHTNTPKHKYHE